MKIKAGYRVEVTSWENDADHYATKSKDGLSKEEAAFFIDICRLISDSKHNSSFFGNMYNPSYTELKKFAKAAKLVFFKHKEAMKYYELNEESDDDEFLDATTDILYDFCGGGEYYTRVVDMINVTYTPVEISLENVTKEFV